MSVAPSERPVRDRWVVADLDRRCYAFAVDAVVVGVLVVLLSYAAAQVLPGVLAVLATMVGVVAAYAAVLGASGRTPGFALLGLRVVSASDGRPIGFSHALQRTLVLAVAAVPFGLGLAALAWTAVADPAHQRRGWHDRLVGSVVVEEQPEPAERCGRGPAAGREPHRGAARARPSYDGNALPQQHPRPPAPRPTAGQANHWGLVLDTGEQVTVDGVVRIGGSRIEVAADGALVVTDRGSPGGTVLVRCGVARRLGVDRPATLLEGDEITIGDRALTVVRVD